MRTQDIMGQKVLKGTPKHLALEQPLGEVEAEYLLLNTSADCNYHCLKCCNAKDGSDGREVSLSLDEQLAIIDQAKEELGTRVLVLAGEGETLLSPNLDQIIEHAHGQGLTTIMFTNGSLITRQKAEFFRDHDVSLIISCDSLKPKKYNRLVGVPGASTVVAERIGEISGVYKDTRTIIRTDNHPVELYRLAFNIVVTKDNEDEVRSMRDFCSELGIMAIMNYPVVKGTLIKHAAEMVGGEQEQMNQELTALMYSDNRGFSGTTPKGTCGYLYYGISIGIDGSILAPCAYCPENEGLLPNIKAYLGKLGGFIEARKLVKATVDRFTAEYSEVICLPRHEDFGRYMEMVKD